MPVACQSREVTEPQRDLSAKLTEGLCGKIFRLRPTFGKFAVLSRPILPALRATSLYTREASSGCGGKDETPMTLQCAPAGAGTRSVRFADSFPGGEAFGRYAALRLPCAKGSKAASRE